MRDSESDFIRSVRDPGSCTNLGSPQLPLGSAPRGEGSHSTPFGGPDQGADLLQASGVEWKLGHLVDAISTHRAGFFREIAHFDFLRDVAIPEILQRHHVGPSNPLRVWSTACSSGEEPYSLAMILADSTTRGSWHVDATDTSRHLLEVAAAALYRGETISRLSPETVRKYFERGPGPYHGYHRVRSALRDRVSFHRRNLLEDPPPHFDPFHVIFCRDVLTYFDRSTQEELVGRLASQLVPGGYLCVGLTESLADPRHSLQSIQPAVYRRPPHS